VSGFWAAIRLALEATAASRARAIADFIVVLPRRNDTTVTDATNRDY
jgi:hypothetical protein